MWELVPFLPFLLGGVSFWIAFVQHRRLRVWRDAAVSCGLKELKISSPMAMRLKLEARAGPVAVRIEDSRDRVVVVLPGPQGISGVRIRHEGYRPPEARAIAVGDELFDSKFFVEGPMRLLSGLLDAETRRLLLGLNVEDWLEITRDELRVETFEKNLKNLLPLILDLGRRFARRLDVAQRLSENARHDPEAGVRLQNLLLLIRELPGKPPTLVALRKACSDPTPEIRLRAAMALGGERRDVLVELAASLVDDAVSAEALSALDHELPFERTRAVLDQALDRRRIQTARACLEAIGTSGAPAAVDALTNVLAVESDLATAAALALGATGSPAAEPPLLRALQRARPDLRVAAATALGRVGSAAAVLPLKDAAESSPRDKDLHRATRQAVAEIQSRLQSASPGQLSLAGADVGQLSLAQTEGGELSLATDPAG